MSANLAMRCLKKFFCAQFYLTLKTNEIIDVERLSSLARKSQYMPDIVGRCRPAKGQAAFQPLSTGQGNFLLLLFKFEIMVGVRIIALYRMDMMTFGRYFDTDHLSFGKRSDVVIESGRPIGW